MKHLLARIIAYKLNPVNFNHFLKALTADPVPPYADEDLLLAITDDDIRTYLADYCSSNVSLSKAYIPVRFDEHHNAYNCLGDVIANHLNMKVYIFRYSSSTRHMDYLGTIGNPDSTNIRYVLQHGDHYWALYHNSFSEAEKARLRQIECNQTGKVLVRDSRTVAAVTHNDDAIPSQASSVSQGGALADPSHFAKRDIRRFLKPKTRASVS